MRAVRSAGIVLAIVCVVSSSPSLAQRPLRPNPLILASAPADLIDRLRADPFTYFRFINRAWTERVCEAFADLPSPTIVRLHGDAHVEQFALTQDAWGLDDFDDSTRGPAFIDVVRFLGSLDLASRQRGWPRDRDRLWTRFFAGYRLGLSDPDSRPPEPEIVGRLRRQAPTRAAHLEWGEQQMQPLDQVRSTALVSSMENFERMMRAERPELAPGYFAIRRAGWLRMGVGSATIRKILMRVAGPTADPDDDVLLEGKEVVSLEGLRCLEAPTTPPATRVIAGARQLGRVKHDILAVAPTLLMPAVSDNADHWLDWWISSWEPTYREVRLDDLRSVDDLAEIAFVSGWQLGVGKVPSVRGQELSSHTMLESRLRKETALIVEELVAGWRELAGRR
jgi:uncharacterized protein (DUF2252 family)